MGLMDKAKKAAEQAQQKIEEKQREFNQKQAAGAGAGRQDAVKFDEHGRPVSDEPPPAAQAPPPSAQPVPPPADGANTSPDPFKPIDS